MIWQESPETSPDIPAEYNDVLKFYDSEWYRIRLGRMFNPDKDKVYNSVLYHVINNKTGVIEFQSSYLPSAVGHAEQMGRAMDKLNEVPSVDAPSLVQ